MKLWVSFIVAAMWVAHLPSEGNAKTLRERSATDEGEHRDLGTSITNMQKSEKDSKDAVIMSASLVLRRKFPSEDFAAYRDLYMRTLMSLTPEDLKRDDLQSVFVKKYRDGSDYTAEDEDYYNAFKEITVNRKLMDKISELEKKKSTVDAVIGRKQNEEAMQAAIESFAGMTIEELKSPNFLQILEEKMDTFIAKKAKNV